MKKLFKKIGIFALICGVLSPFASFPKASAQSDCKWYLNQYLFMDELSPYYWDIYEDSDGLTTYTSFLYTFPEVAEGQKLRIESLGEVLLDKNELLEAFLGNVISLGEENKSSSNSIAKFGNHSDITLKDGSYESITTILHGYWGYEDEEWEQAGWELESNEDNDKEFRKSTIQGVLIANDKLDKVDMKVTFGGAEVEYKGKKDSKFYSAGNYTSRPLDFMKKIVSDIENNDNDSYNKGYVWIDSNTEQTFFNLRIRRKIKDDSLNEMTFGGKDDDGRYYVWTTDSEPDNDKKKIENSYTAMSSYGHLLKDDITGNEANDANGNFCVSGNSEDKADKCYKKYTTSKEYDFDIGKEYHWPSILNIEYSICPTAATQPDPTNPEKTYWTLAYKPGTENPLEVKDLPGNEKAETGVGIKVSSKTPSRDGFSFNGWKLCDGNDTYKAGDEVKNTKANATVELCAQWGQTGPEEPKKQGVISYVLGFAAVGLVAGTIYIISKKKNLFKQI